MKLEQEKYERYLNEIDNENLSETEIREIKKILEIAKSIDLFDIEIPDRIVPPGEKELGRVNAFEIKGEIKNFLELYKETKRAIKAHSSKSRGSSGSSITLTIKNIMSI